MVSNILVLLLTAAAFLHVSLANSSLNMIYTVETSYVYESDGDQAKIIITRTNSSYASNFKYELKDGTAKLADGDFSFGGVLVPEVFGMSTATVTLTVTINDDSVEDPGEYFVLRLSEFSDDDTAAFDSNINIGDSTDVDLNCPDMLYAKENDMKFVFNLTRDPDYASTPLTVNVQTSDLPSAGGSTPVNAIPGMAGPLGVAVDGEDYTGVDLDITFGVGELWKTVEIDILDDEVAEGLEAFLLDITGDGIATCTFIAEIDDDDRPVPHHCLRVGQECQNGGTCDTTTGECDCVDGFIARDCSLTNDNQTGCDQRCDPGGFCRSSGSPAVISCHCKPGFAGEFCNNTAYNADCKQNGFGLCVTPYGDFTGSIYVKGKPDVPECNFKKVEQGDIAGVQSWCEGYYLDLNYTGMADGVSCADITPEIDGSNNTYKVESMVQYADDLTSAIDEVFTAFCRIDADGVVMASNIVEVNADPRYLKKQVATGESSVVDFSIKVRGNDIGDQIFIDDDIQICASVQTATAWNCVRIKQVRLDNNRADPDYKEGIVYNEGCVHSAYASTVLYSAAWDNGNMNVSCITIRPFRFDQDFELELFQMRITVIADLPTDSCTEFSCVTRRKRQAAGEENGVYVVEVITRSRSQETGEIVGNEVSDEATIVNNETEESSMLPLIIGATVGGTLLLVSTIVIGYIAHRRRRKDPLDM